MSSPSPSARSGPWAFLRNGTFWTIIGAIAGVLSVIVAIIAIGVTPDDDGPNGGGTVPTPVSPVNPATAIEGVARAIPNAETIEARPLVAGIEPNEAKYRLEGLQVANSAPKIEASGRISGYATGSKQILQMLSWGDPDTVDLTGDPGDGRYYHVGS